MLQPAQLAIEALNAARRWVHSRVALKRALDSKSATAQQVEKAKRGYNLAAEELESAIVKLERQLLQNGKQVSMKKGAAGAPIPWREIVSMVSAGARAIETAIDPGPTAKVTVVSRKPIIDAEIE